MSLQPSVLRRQSIVGLTEDITFVRSQLQAYSEGCYLMGVAAVEDDGSGVPPEMFDGDVNDEGWVAWRLLPSTLSDSDVTRLETEYAVEFPPLFRAYLLAWFQLFDQIHSTRHDQLIFNTDVPSNDPLGPISGLIDAWQPLLSAQFVPFAEWGDGWGPMCFDTVNRLDDGDCPIVWMDHDLLIPLGLDKLRDREAVLPHVNPLYDSYRDFFDDAFTHD